MARCAAFSARSAWLAMEADVTELVKLRESKKEAFGQRHGVDLTYLPFMAHAVAQTLLEHPYLNASWGEDKIVLKKRINLAIAVATLWLVGVGGAADPDDDTSPLLADLDIPPLTARRSRRATRLRLVGIFRRGWILILIALLRHAPPTFPLSFVPDPWPSLPAPDPPHDAPSSALPRTAA